MAAAATYREIPFNYTSADDRLVVVHLLGEQTWERLEALRSRRVTGRSARLLFRVVGAVFIHRRNAFLFQELVDSAPRRRRLFRSLAADLEAVERAAGEPLVHEVLAASRALVGDFEREVAGAAAER
ncbi:MAG TPA: DUF3683 domain-containing protein, partial [Anaeromyxobacteraceae bacterium]